MTVRPRGAWVRLSGYYMDDDAIMEAGEDAEIAYVRILAYASRQPEHEGWVSGRVITQRLGLTPRYGSDGTVVEGTTAEDRLHALVSVGLVEEEGGRYRPTGWLKWNASAEEITHSRAKDRDRKRRARRPDGQDTDTASRPDGHVSVSARTETGQVAVSERTARGVHSDTDSCPANVRTADTDTDTDKPIPATCVADDSPQGHRNLTATAPHDAETAPLPIAVDDVDSFDAFWAAYPKRRDKDDARKAWAQVLRDGASPSAIIAAAEVVGEEWKRTPKDRRQFVKYPASWLRAGSWHDEPEDDDVVPVDPMSDPYWYLGEPPADTPEEDPFHE